MKQGENLLVQSSPFEPKADEYCVDLLSSPASENRAVLEVTYLHTPAQRITAWNKCRGGVPTKWTIITVDTDQHEEQPTESASVTADPTRVSVPASNDVSTLGIRITDWLDRFNEQAEETSLCFYSITALFQYINRTQGLKFLDALTSKTSEVNARAHFHMDPLAHEEATREAIEGHFDTILPVE